MLTDFVATAYLEIPGLAPVLHRALPAFEKTALDATGRLQLSTSQKTVTLSSKGLLKLLLTTAPEKAVPVIFRMCLAYDDAAETNACLQRHVDKYLEEPLEPAFFYLHPKKNWICAEVESLGRGVKATEEIKIVALDASVLLLLPSHPTLQRVLLHHLAERAL